MSTLSFSFSKAYFAASSAPSFNKSENLFELFEEADEFTAVFADDAGE